MGYRFEYSVEKACEHGHALAFGSDTFCRIVQVLEDMAHLFDHGIEDLQQWVEGMDTHPDPKVVSELRPAYMPAKKKSANLLIKSLSSHPT